MVTFQAGETEQEVLVELLQDEIVEGPESFSAELTGLEATLSLAGGSVIVTIIDDDRVIIEFVSAEYTVMEGEDEVVLVVVKRGQALRNVSLTFSTIDETASGNICKKPDVIHSYQKPELLERFASLCC